MRYQISLLLLTLNTEFNRSKSCLCLVSRHPIIWVLFILTFEAGLFSSQVVADESELLRDKYQNRLDAAVERGLHYLAQNQIDRNQAASMNRPEIAGSFLSPSAPGNTGISSLAVMAFLAKGHLPGTGKYGSVINQGIDYILSQQLDNGLLICKNRNGRTTGLMYSHSISTLLLCEVSGMVDIKRQQKIDQVLPKALLVLLQAQKVPKSQLNTGGWRYSPGTTESDLSLTGWSIMALRAAKLNGAAIPDEHIEMAVSYILNCHTPSGGFSYMPNNGKVSSTMTGIAVLCLELCGEHGNEDLFDAGEYILRHPPLITKDNAQPTPHRYYGFYYCGQAMFQLGGKYWNEFAPYMYDTLLEDQNANGSWTYPQGSHRYNTTYPTSLSILTLTVSARQLPIYQREE